MIFCGLAILATSINALFSPSSNTGLLNVSQRHPPGCEGAYYGWANPARVAACKEAFGLLSRFSDVGGVPQKFGPKGIGGENTVLPWRLSSCELPIAISHIAILSIFTLFMGKSIKGVLAHGFFMVMVLTSKAADGQCTFDIQFREPRRFSPEFARWSDVKNIIGSLIRICLEDHLGQGGLSHGFGAFTNSYLRSKPFISKTRQC